jgi:hypothetical protein
MKYLVLVDNLKGSKEQFIVNESDVQMFLIDHPNCVKRCREGIRCHLWVIRTRVYQSEMITLISFGHK